MRIESDQTDGANASVGNSNDSTTGSNGMATALEELKSIAKTKKAEPICAAYQNLRKAARGMKVSRLFELIDGALGKSGTDIVASAYSHRHCFMCGDGTAQCETCGGTGLLEKGRRCPSCEGLGAISCGFCRGTGWADRETAPPEFKAAITKRQSAHLNKELQRLVKAFSGITKQSVAGLSEKVRTELIHWMMRLESRISDLGDSETADADRQLKIGSFTQQIEHCLDILRRP